MADVLDWARARLARAEEAGRGHALPAEHRAVAQAMRELLAAFATRVPRRGWAYRVTWQDAEGISECDEGWTWDEKDPWTHDAAAATGLEAAERDVPGDASYVVHVALVEHGWPSYLAPFHADDLLEHAEEIASEEPDCFVGEAERGAWSDVDDVAVAELDSALVTTWHTWCRKYCTKIGISRIVGTPDVVGARDTRPGVDG